MRDSRFDYFDNNYPKREYSRQRPAAGGFILALIGIAAAFIILSLAVRVFTDRPGYARAEIPVQDQQAQDPNQNTLQAQQAANQDTAQNNGAALPQGSSASWADKFADKFAAGDAETDGSSYKSKNISVQISKFDTGSTVYFVTDIYLSSIEQFKTAFAGDKFEVGLIGHTVDIAKQNGAVIAISGDYYGARNKGIVIRNGELFRDEPGNEDLLIMYNDGSMQTYSPGEIDAETAISNGAYQSWSFGPMLLDGGMPMAEFNSEVNPANPRSAIGYYEPGHYCMILVDGRQQDYSEGLTLQEMSQLFYNLGCKTAYNLDGGQSAIMAFMDGMVNRPYDGGREVSDIIYIADCTDH